MWRVARRIFVHAANEHLSARLLIESQLPEDIFQSSDYRPVILIFHVLSRDRNRGTLDIRDRCQEPLDLMVNWAYVRRKYRVRIFHRRLCTRHEARIYRKYSGGSWLRCGSSVSGIGQIVGASRNRIVQIRRRDRLHVRRILRQSVWARIHKSRNWGRSWYYAIYRLTGFFIGFDTPFLQFFQILSVLNVRMVIGKTV